MIDIPDGWVLVPNVPTPEMIAAGDTSLRLHRRGTPNTWGKVYRAMIAAAPVCTPLEVSYAHLKPFGYAPGDYMGSCRTCNKMCFDLDKRASCCRKCAEEKWLVSIEDNMTTYGGVEFGDLSSFDQEKVNQGYMNADPKDEEEEHPNSEDICPNCGSKWINHDFGVPTPLCP